MCNINKRVKYKKSPLREVAYQINFPAILSIDTDIPAIFQSRIRDVFPIYRTEVAREGDIVINVAEEIIKPSFSQSPDTKWHLFISDDGQWKITLLKNQITLSTLKYTQWEDMLERFSLPLQAFVDTYNPAYSERVGLRYVDLINKRMLGLDNVEWRELLQPHLLGCLCYSPNKNYRVRSNSTFSDIVIDDIEIRIRTAIIPDRQQQKNNNYNLFIIDCDYHKEEKKSFTSIEEVAFELHQTSTMFFRQSIKEKLHLAMEPENVE